MHVPRVDSQQIDHGAVFGPAADAAVPDRYALMEPSPNQFP
jgi:hypothetical protein